MIKEIQISVSPQVVYEKELLKHDIALALNIPDGDITTFQIVRKSIDARQRQIKFNVSVKVYIGEMTAPSVFKHNYQNTSAKEHAIVVGSGPAGLFAALRLIELGVKPIIIERGKDISARKRDIAFISREHLIDPESNYCFGEGGAGTFSDGKLYTRSNKRGDIERILQILHFHGANPDILYEAHPHIGTDKLPEIIKNIRQTILDCGGEIHFNTKLTDILITNGAVKGIRTSLGDTIEGKALILATGHSARDIYELLLHKEILLESKPFAMGVRVEHPQELIDSIQYHVRNRGKYLPAAAYNVVSQVDGRGVYSFCMCPGGYIVPSATSTDEIVVNGMSSSNRHTPFANSGIVVEIKTEDLPGTSSDRSVLAGLDYQRFLEQLAKQNGQGQAAPAQRLTDFTEGRASSSLPESSYTPGLISSPLHSWLPDHISKRLREGFVQFDKKMKGFLTKEAYIAGVESRTSSPVRIPRQTDNRQHPGLKGLFPCGEGSGYAGGIVSSAMDGEKAADALSIFGTCE
jgi:uncharacterized protein